MHRSQESPCKLHPYPIEKEYYKLPRYKISTWTLKIILWVRDRFLTCYQLLKTWKHFGTRNIIDKTKSDMVPILSGDCQTWLLITLKLCRQKANHSNQERVPQKNKNYFLTFWFQFVNFVAAGVSVSFSFVQVLSFRSVGFNNKFAQLCLHYTGQFKLLLWQKQLDCWCKARSVGVGAGTWIHFWQIRSMRLLAWQA